jgi:hypothetical protein
LTSTALSGAAFAQAPSGTAVKVAPDASASGITGARTLQAPGDIFQGDKIETSANGQAQIRFVDDTRFVVGPNSRVTIDEFVFNPNQTAESVLMNAAKGTFRFISGRSPSQAYTVRTPTMTVGVRGSAYNFSVLSDGRTLLQWLEARGFVCVVPRGATNSGRSDCIEVNAGDFIGASPGGGFDAFRPGERVHLQTQLFSGFNTQGGFATGFGVQVPAGNRGSPETFRQGSDDDGDDTPPPYQ